MSPSAALQGRGAGREPANPRRALRAALLAAVCAAVPAGCTGSLFQSKAAAPSTYLLSARLAPADPASWTNAVVAADLAVQRPRVRTGLETDRIAVLYADRRLDYYADARWSGPLDQVVQDLAVQAFDTGGRLRSVSAESSAFPSGYWLEVRVADFQAEYSRPGSPPSAHVHLLVRVGASGDRHVLGTFEADAREPAAHDRLGPIVDAYEHAVDTALAQVVAETTRLLATASEHR
jgi:ABC-type uncharacterized transport system auxiliary subunit